MPQQQALPPPRRTPRTVLISDDSEEWSDDPGVRDTSSRSRSASAQRGVSPIARLRSRLSAVPTIPAHDSDAGLEPSNRSHRYSRHYPSPPRRQSSYGAQSQYSAGGQMNPYTGNPFTTSEHHFPRHQSNGIPPPPPAGGYQNSYYGPYPTHDLRSDHYDYDTLYNTSRDQTAGDTQVEDLQRKLEEFELEKKREEQRRKRQREKSKLKKAEEAAAVKKYEEQERERRRERSRDRKYDQLKSEMEELKRASTRSEAQSAPRERSRGPDYSMSDVLLASLLGRSPFDQASMVSPSRDYEMDRARPRHGYWRSRPRATSFNEYAYPDEVMSQLDHVIQAQDHIQRQLASRFERTRHGEDRYSYEHEQVPHPEYHSYPRIKHHEGYRQPRSIDRVRSPTEHGGTRISYPLTPPSTRESGSNLSSRPDSMRSGPQRGRSKHHGRRERTGRREPGELFDVTDEDEERPVTPKRGSKDKPQRGRKHVRRTRRSSHETEDEARSAMEEIDYRHVDPRIGGSRKDKPKTEANARKGIREKSQKGIRSRNGSVHDIVLIPPKSQDRAQSESESDIDLFPPRSRGYAGGHDPKHSRSQLRGKSVPRKSVPPPAPSVPESGDSSSDYSLEDSEESDYVPTRRNPKRLT